MARAQRVGFQDTWRATSKIGSDTIREIDCERTTAAHTLAKPWECCQCQFEYRRSTALYARDRAADNYALRSIQRWLSVRCYRL
jgi:hypothetical protein